MKVRMRRPEWAYKAMEPEINRPHRKGKVEHKVEGEYYWVEVEGNPGLEETYKKYLDMLKRLEVVVWKYLKR